ncbi:hypothetical protein [Micromonospora sp. DT62]|uniref:hypothetical protein n=1 Tax=Micromonospora sp. DT62 TaxID=3416521 RepID=UPI003CF67E7F
MTLPNPEPVTDPVADLSALLDQLAGDPDVTPPAAMPPDDAAAPEPAYRNVEAFVTDYLAHVVERRLATGPTSGVNWCPAGGHTPRRSPACTPSGEPGKPSESATHRPA